MPRGPASGAPAVLLLRQAALRSILIQTVLCLLLAAVVGLLVWAAAENLARAKVASGFGFWSVTAGFDISQTLIDYSSSTSTYGRAFWVGLLNTLLVAAIGVVLATVVGFGIGIARLSTNWLVAHLAAGYVQLVRNVPLLLQLLFWYNAVLKALPEIAASVVMPGGFILNNRGLFIPRPLFADGSQIVAVLAFTVVLAGVFNAPARRDCPAL